MKKTFMILALILVAMLMLTACDNNGNGENGDGNGGGRSGGPTMGQPFEVDGLEITLSPNLGFTRFRSTFSDNDGAYVFYIPVTVTNIDDSSNGLNSWGVEVFSPAGIGLISGAWELESEFSETSIFAVGDVQPGVTKEGNIYVFYDEDGDYIIEFSTFMETDIAITFTVNFNFDAVPEVITEFVAGETFEFDGMEFTIHEGLSWGTIRDTFSDYNGEHYFMLTVTMHNVSDESNGFPWGVDIFAPNGNALPTIHWWLDEDDIRDSNDILPGVSYTGILHALYVGDGEYIVEFSSWAEMDDITVHIQVELDPDELPVFQTEFELNETFIFDELEITIIDDVQWNVIDDRWSNLDGRLVMSFPITVTNVGDSSNSLNSFDVSTFGPDGIQLDTLRFRGADDCVFDSGDIRPGATLNSVLHVLYDGGGEYVLEFSTWRESNIYVIFTVISTGTGVTDADDD